jgi:hypothetical protein
LQRRLDRLGRRATRLERDINTMVEAPSIGENENDASRKEARNQYQKFVEYVATRMAGGH